ncbi:peptide-methionine (R)-S-oxide reductase [Malassezia sp. CBS 17886]|nr:peptide-methionine (R)-S-oxide reductase [Malassezia sp. CBS 17886]
MPTSLPKNENEWRAVLTPDQFHVLREKGTEPAGTGAFDKHTEPGVYHKTKFNSGCGWPAFFEAVPGAITRYEDSSYGMRRTEINCKNCGGHLGHVFHGEGFPTPTDERHCVNSISLSFAPGDA